MCERLGRGLTRQESPGLKLRKKCNTKGTYFTHQKAVEKKQEKKQNRFTYTDSHKESVQVSECFLYS